MRVAAYARVSTGKEEQATSILNQELMFEDYTKNRNWNPPILYVDRKSGTKAKRPELLKLIDDIKKDKIDIVLVKDLSRLARNGELTYTIVNLLNEKGVKLISLDGMVNTLEGDSNILGLLAWMYEKESQNLSNRIKSTIKIGAKNGKFKGSIAPYGYEMENGKLYVRQDETPTVVKRIYKEYLEGNGLDTIAKNLTIENMLTPAQVAGKKNAGAKWVSSTIKTILTNPHYIGNLVQQRTTTISVVSTKRKDLNSDEQIVVENTHEPIITKADFNAVQQMMKSRKQDKTAPSIHLFSNLLYCTECGSGMWYRADRKGYICGTYARYGKNFCSTHQVKEEKLAQAIIKDLEDYLEHIDLELLSKYFMAKVKKALKSNNREIEKIEEKIQVLQNRKGRYVQMYADELIDLVTYKLEVEKVSKELEELNSQKEQNQKDAQKNSESITCIADDFKSYLFSKEVLPELLRRFVSKIEVESDGSPQVFYNFQEPSKQLASLLQ